MAGGTHEADYDWHYRKTCDVARQLALAGLAVAWLISEAFHNYGHGGNSEAHLLSARITGLHPAMMTAVYLFAVVLLLDLAHLFVVTLRLAGRARRTKFADTGNEATTFSCCESFSCCSATHSCFSKPQSSRFCRASQASSCSASPTCRMRPARGGIA